MKPTIKLGSLFDGIGAVPYAASFFGIETLWASEIMPNPISVTRRHFPGMEHLGDITKLDGGKLPPVDIIAFGSPCQSWSVAGDRSGLEGKSGLFMEAIRIIREMRYATNGRYPQIALFENVTGLLNCGAGGRSNYQTVLEAFTETEIPMPESGRWANAGMVRGNGIDLAWIVKDSQYHRTAQRRKRLFVVVDFTGRRAGEILFVSKSLSGYFAARERERERTAADTESGTGSAGGCGINADIAGTLDASYGKGPGMRGGIERDVVLCMATGQSNAEILDNLSATLNCACEQPIMCMPGQEAVVGAFMAGQAKNARSIAYSETLSPTLKGSPSGLNQMPCICEPSVYGICSDKSNSMRSGNPHSGIYKAETCRTLDQNCANPGCNQGGMVVVEPQIARTLTARHDSSPCADRGQNVVAIHQNQQGEVRTSDVAYTLNTNANASGRNAPLICEEKNCLNPWDTQQARVFTGDGVSPTLAGADGGGGRNPAGLVMCAATTQVNAEILPDLCPTITAAAGESGNNKPYIVYPCAMTMRLREGCEGGGKGPLIQVEKSGTLATGNDQYLFCKRTAAPCVHPPVTGTLCASGAGLSRPAGNANETDLCVTYCLQGNMIGRQDHNGPQGNGINEEVSFTLSATDHHAVAIPINTQIATRHIALGERTGFGVGKDGDPAFTLQAAHCHAVATVDCRNLCENGEISGTLQSKPTGGYSLNYQNPVRTGYIVRRLTPTEAERLMSLPDDWTAYGHDGKLMSDSARYQMCGNSIVVNVLAYIMQNIAEKLGKED
ncbi:MAG: DNA cytosine methyltransferase [Oscillospiraceae bacterium]|jgi:site-specific DNA-cytosine methylase|nr:DNA cytosine methyltransferase [Oscillospiraceae bacterium]